MGLRLQDIQTLRRGSMIQYYCPKKGWANAKIVDMGLNHFHLQALEGSKMGHAWKEDIFGIMEFNKYHLYIPPPEKKPAWIWWWLRQILTKILRKLPQ